MQEEIYKAASPFIVMAKPVGSLCNLECHYCYYLETAQYDKGLNRARMPNELLERYIRQYIEAAPGPVIQFTWHGGEPTLAGLDYYRLVVRLQNKYLPEDWECWNNLQTNGVLLDDEWCAFLAENRFDVGLSMDGTAQLHDEFRKDHAGNGSYDRVLAAVRRLQAHGVQPDLLCTVNSSTTKAPLDVYRALKKLGTGWIQFIPIIRRVPDGGVTPDSVTSGGYCDFLCDIFDEWLLHDLGATNVQLFAEAAQVWSGGSASLCWMAPTCGRALIVERDGGVYSCDHFVSPEHRLGNIESSHLGALADSGAQLAFGSGKRDALPGQCRACPWLGVCNGGCPKDRFEADENGEAGLNYLCGGLRRFFSHARAPLGKLMAMRRSGMTPAAVMAAMRSEALAKWKNVGRNDPCPCGSGRKAKHCCWSKRP